MLCVFGFKQVICFLDARAAAKVCLFCVHAESDGVTAPFLLLNLTGAGSRCWIVAFLAVGFFCDL